MLIVYLVARFTQMTKRLKVLTKYVSQRTFLHEEGKLLATVKIYYKIFTGEQNKCGSKNFMLHRYNLSYS